MLLDVQDGLDLGKGYNRWLESVMFQAPGCLEIRTCLRGHFCQAHHHPKQVFYRGACFTNKECRLPPGRMSMQHPVPTAPG